MVTAADDPFALPRREMVEDQLQARGIRDVLVLTAMGRVPREAFVPAFVQHQAYDDRPLLIGHEQTISQPYIVALMTEALEVGPGDRVLEIGTGSGYQTAVLADLGAEVFTVERIEKLSRRARLVLSSLGYGGVHFRVADGSLGWPEAAPFDGILVAAGAVSLPEAYHAQLREGRHLVIPVGPPNKQILRRLTRRGEGWEAEDLTPVSFVPLVSGD